MKHKYKRTRPGRPQVCIRCGVKRRSALDANRRRRPAVDAPSNRWQYKPPCSGSWQFEHLPCVSKEPK